MNKKSLQARKDALKAKEEMLKAKEEVLNAKDKMLELQYDNLCTANAELLHQQGKLSLQSVFEHLKNNAKNYLI